MDGRKIANLLQEGYRMPKPQHLDDKLYVNIVLLPLVFGFSCLFVCLVFFMAFNVPMTYRDIHNILMFQV